MFNLRQPLPRHRLAACALLALICVPAMTQEAGISEAMKAQILLDRAGISPGVIDGLWGDNTRSALRAFQRARGLDATGSLDQATRDALGFGQDGLIVDYTLTEEDVAGPFVDQIPEEMLAQAKLDRLAYTSATEAVAEKFHLTEDALTSLNPDVALKAGTKIRVPAVLDSLIESGPSGDGSDGSGALRVVVDKSESSLEVRDAEDELIFFAPVTAGSAANPLPLGEWKVAEIAVEPTYHYNPELFQNADPSDPEASLPPGPNNPVGLVWIGIDKEHYGIHGTPDPADIGYDASAGCVRLTNWDAQDLAHMVSAGTEVIFKE